MAIDPERLYTYQDLANEHYRVHHCTVRRWFKRRKKFRPTETSVRIKGSEVLKFDQEQSKGKK